MKKLETIDNSESNIEIIANIILAIETHNNIAIEYTKDTNSSAVREVLPHNLYRNNKDNTKVMLDGFQINGASKSGSINSFKQFDTTLIKSCCILNEKFNIQQSYNPDSDRYKDSIIGIVA